MSFLKEQSLDKKRIQFNHQACGRTGHKSHFASGVGKTRPGIKLSLSAVLRFFLRFRFGDRKEILRDRKYFI